MIGAATTSMFRTQSTVRNFSDTVSTTLIVQLIRSMNPCHATNEMLHLDMLVTYSAYLNKAVKL
jgi:hypothetical protein